MKWPPGELDSIIDACTRNGDMVAEVADANPVSAHSLRHALYRRMRERGVQSIRMSLEGAKVLLLWDPAPRVLLATRGEKV